jgi:xylan 1,4-beta-xylosidase
MVSQTSILALIVGLLPVAKGTIYPDCTRGPLKNNLVCNPNAPAAARAAALVKVMPLADKLNNLDK